MATYLTITSSAQYISSWSKRVGYSGELKHIDNYDGLCLACGHAVLIYVDDECDRVPTLLHELVHAVQHWAEELGLGVTIDKGEAQARLFEHYAKEVLRYVQRC